MGEIILPPEYKNVSGPLIFLAGPIKGSANWQGDAIEQITKGSDVHIACPRRSALPTGTKLEGRGYHEQVDWEHHYLDYAAEHGVIVFWLAKQDHETPGRAYAQTSRLELGEAIARHYLQNIKLVVGVEEGFTNERYIRRTLAQKCASVKVFAHMSDTIEEAIKMAV